MLPARRLRWIIAVLAVVGVLAGEGAGVAQAAPKLEVMTRNMYLGADLTPVLQAQTPAQFLAAAGQAFTTVQASDPPERIKAMAREIAAADPAIVGLQEVELWQTDTEPPTLDGPATPANSTRYDFLQLLLDALAAQGTPYTEVTTATNAANEVPTSLGFDVKLTDRDVLLAKSSLSSKELSWSNASSANFAANLTVTTGVGSITITRGYNVADFTAKKRPFRLVNTHLEPSADQIQDAQAVELLNGVLSSTTQTQLLVGDINSDPGETGTNPYDLFAGAGFADSWTQANPTAAGLTCCFGELLLDADASVFSSRIDVVLTRGANKAAKAARIFGIDPNNRTPSGLWPSDHAGVSSTVAP
ncbi:MAG: endonuclease/exonuclease/phosphatase family protein [Actinomycetota bacterium]|nr:endonuclease/exonuclease/phosphatase family protein [Actinomycetota bacterium]